MVVLSDGVERSELGNSSCAPGDPAKNVDLGGIGEGVCETVGDDFKNRVGGKVAIVVDVRFNHSAVHAVDDELFIFVKGKLHVRFAELDLLPA